MSGRVKVTPYPYNPSGYLALSIYGSHTIPVSINATKGRRGCTNDYEDIDAIIDALIQFKIKGFEND